VLSSRHNEQKEKDFNFFSKKEAISSIFDLTVLSLNGMLAASSRVNEFPKDFTAAMMHFFINFPSENGLKFFAIKFETAYDAVRVFSESVALERLRI